MNIPSTTFPDAVRQAMAHLTEADGMATMASLQTRAIAVDQRSIATAYVQRGEGQPPFLLLHGFDSSLLEFRRLLPRLAEERATWAVDLLGFGFTERPAGVVFSAAAIKAHLRALWEVLIHQPVVLIGASMGGAVAIDWALTYPESVAGLVLIDSAGLTAPPPPGPFFVPPLGFLATEVLRNPWVRRRICQNAYHDSSWATPEADRWGSLHLGMPGWRRALVSFTRRGGYGAYGEKLRHLHVPTLILWGDDDRILGTTGAEVFHRAIAPSQLEWIPHCGHLPHLERPDLTAQRILAFGKPTMGSPHSTSLGES